MRSLTPAAVIAQDLIRPLGDSGGRYISEFLTYIASALREMNLFLTQDTNVRTKVLPVGNVIEMPSDFIYETKVGIMRNGRVATLSLDKNYRKYGCHNQSEAVESIYNITDGLFYPDIYYTFYNYDGNDLGELCGLGCGYNVGGFYNINRKQGTIEIGSLFPEDAEFVVEYKSDGTEDGMSMIPTEMVTAVKRYAMSEFNRYRNASLSLRDEQAYQMEYNRLKRLYNFKPVSYYATLFQANVAQIPY